MDQIPEQYIVIDFETSGRDPHSCEPIEVAAVVMIGGEEVDCFSSMIKPSRSVDGSEAQRINGITDAMLADAPSYSLVAKRLCEWLGEWADFPVLAHNGDRFDFIIARRMFPVRNTTIDTLPLFRSLLPGLASYAQGAVGSAVGVLPVGAHRAQSDVRHLAALLEHCRSLPARELDILEVVGSVERGASIIPSDLQAQLDGTRERMLAQVATMQDRAQAVLQHCGTLTCNDDFEERRVIEVMANLRKLSKAIEKWRTGQLAPVKAMTAAVEAQMRDTVLRPLEAGLAALERLREPLALRRAQEAERRRRAAEEEAQRVALERQKAAEAEAAAAAAAARAAAEMFGTADVSGEILADGAAAALDAANETYTETLSQMQAPAAPVRSAAGTMRDEIVYVVDVIAPGAVPAQYCSPDLAKIQRAVDAARGEIDIPGVRITQRVKQALRTR